MIRLALTVLPLAPAGAAHAQQVRAALHYPQAIGASSVAHARLTDQRATHPLHRLRRVALWSDGDRQHYFECNCQKQGRVNRCSGQHERPALHDIVLFQSLHGGRDCSLKKDASRIPQSGEKTRCFRRRSVIAVQASSAAEPMIIRRCGSMRGCEGRRLGFSDGLDVSSVHDNVVAVVLIS